MSKLHETLRNLNEPKTEFDPIKVLEEKLSEAIKSESKPRPAKSVHPSNFTACIRALYYDQLYAVNHDVTTLKRFRNGTRLHDDFEGLLKKAGILVTNELTFPKVMGANGRLDAIIELLGKQFLLEYKGVKDTTFKRIQRKPDTSNLWQLHWYMYRAELPGLLFYECKNTQAYKIYYYPTYDAEIIEAIFEKLKILESHFSLNHAPDRPFVMRGKECAWCDHKKVCWAKYKKKEVTNPEEAWV